MARPTKQRAPEQTDAIAAANIDHEALDAAGRAATEHGQHLALVEAQFGVDIPYNLDLYVSAIRQRAIESAQRLIEIGRMLLIMRERETRDAFLQAVERSGLALRFAQRAMQAAVKLQDRSAIQRLGVAKALELVAEDDDSLDALESGGTIAGLTLDEIDRMSLREARAALRKERAERAEEKEADEEIIRQKDQRINKLSRRATRSSQREAVAQLLEDLDRLTVDIASSVKLLLDTTAAIDSVYADAGLQTEDDVQERVETDLRAVADKLLSVTEALGE